MKNTLLALCLALLPVFAMGTTYDCVMINFNGFHTIGNFELEGTPLQAKELIDPDSGVKALCAIMEDPKSNESSLICSLSDPELQGFQPAARTSVGSILGMSATVRGNPIGLSCSIK